MSPKEKQLAVSMLKDASELYSNHGYNDFEFPSSWTTAERQKFVEEYHQWNGDLEEFNSDNPSMPDFAVICFLAYKLKMELLNEF